MPHLCPSAASSPPRSSRLSIRASPDELSHWATTALRMGHASTATWVRALLSEAALTGRDGLALATELHRLRGELSRIGNNLNQLAHTAHCGDSVRCGDVLDEIETVKDRVDHLLRSARRPTSRRSRTEAETQTSASPLH